MRELRASGTTILLSAHQMDLVERTADRVLLMNRAQARSPICTGRSERRMTHARQVLPVTGWEFRRYFKWRDQALGLLVFLVIAALAYGGGRIATSGERTLRVGIDHSTVAPLNADDRLELVPAPEESRHRALQRGSRRLQE